MEFSNSSKKHLCHFIENDINLLQKHLLDLIEVVVPREQWDIIRSKVLRLTNNSRRNLCLEIEENYNIQPVKRAEYDEIIEVRKGYRKS